MWRERIVLARPVTVAEDSSTHLGAVLSSDDSDSFSRHRESLLPRRVRTYRHLHGNAGLRCGGVQRAAIAGQPCPDADAYEFVAFGMAVLGL